MPIEVVDYPAYVPRLCAGAGPLSDARNTRSPERASQWPLSGDTSRPSWKQHRVRPVKAQTPNVPGFASRRACRLLMPCSMVGADLMSGLQTQYEFSPLLATARELMTLNVAVFACEDERPMPPQRTQRSPLQRAAASLHGTRVVIVEDEGMTQLQLRKMCASAGMIVVGIAGNGAAGVEKVLATQPDLVLMDVKMPVMNGLDAAERIMAESPRCIVILTAYEDAASRERARALGVEGFVTKPVTSDVLLPHIAEAIARCAKRFGSPGEPAESGSVN